MDIIDIAKTVKDKAKQLDAHWSYIERIQELKDQFCSDTEWTSADFTIEPKDEEELISLLGRKWKNQLKNLASFIGLYKYCTSRKRITELGISTHQEQLLEMFGGSHMNVSNLLKTAVNVGLITCVNDEFRFRNPNFKDSEAYSKRYIWNKRVQDMVLEAVKKYGIEVVKYVRKNRTYDNEKSLGEMTEEMKDMIKVGSNLRIPRKKFDEDAIRAVLDERYPCVVECKRLANYDNEHFLNEREQIKCEWNIVRSKSGKHVSKIGFRATSGIVSFKEHEDGSDRYRGVWRREYLEQELGKEWYSFDVKSSIFRLTYFLNSGVWVDNDVDFYELMYGKKFKSKEDRDAYKAYKMRPYFDSGEKVASHIMPVFEEYQKDDVYRAVKEDKDREEKVIGKSYRSEIFVHESCIYMRLVHRLRTLGYKVIQVYDGFYSNVDISRIAKVELGKICVEYRDEMLKSGRQKLIKNKKKFQKRHIEILEEEINDYNINREIIRGVCGEGGEERGRDNGKDDNIDIDDDRGDDDVVVVDDEDGNRDKKDYYNINREIIRFDKVLERFGAILGDCVSNSLISLESANRISRELGLGKTYKVKDQPLGFCVTEESIRVYGRISGIIRRLKERTVKA